MEYTKGSKIQLFNQTLAHNSRLIKKFKSRALNGHEAFNGMTKSSQILRHLFRHNVEEKIAVAFEAVAVICPYKVENEELLYDILIDDVLNETEEDSDTNMEEMSFDSKEDDYDSDDDYEE